MIFILMINRHHNQGLKSSKMNSIVIKNHFSQINTKVELMMIISKKCRNLQKKKRILICLTLRAILKYQIFRMIK